MVWHTEWDHYMQTLERCWGLNETKSVKVFCREQWKSWLLLLESHWQDWSVTAVLRACPRGKNGPESIQFSIVTVLSGHNKHYYPPGDCFLPKILPHGDGRTHLIHRWVQSKELGMPIGPPGLFILLLEVLSTHLSQEVLQPLIRLQAAKVEATGSEGHLPRHVAQHV